LVLVGVEHKGMIKVMESERIARLEERANHTDDKLETIHAEVTDMRGDIKAMRGDVAAIHILIARHQGATVALRYATHAVAGIIGAVGTFFGLHKG